jgi:hypothetical protein
MIRDNMNFHRMVEDIGWYFQVVFYKGLPISFHMKSYRIIINLSNILNHIYKIKSLFSASFIINTIKILKNKISNMGEFLCD